MDRTFRTPGVSLSTLVTRRPASLSAGIAAPLTRISNGAVNGAPCSRMCTTQSATAVCCATVRLLIQLGPCVTSRGPGNMPHPTSKFPRNEEPLRSKPITTHAPLSASKVKSPSRSRTEAISSHSESATRSVRRESRLDSSASSTSRLTRELASGRAKSLTTREALASTG